MDKIQLRKEISQRRDALKEDLRVEYAQLIKERLENLPVYQNAKTISYFVSFRSEVNTVPLIEEALLNHKRVLLPITNLAERQLIFSELRNFREELLHGAYGILEPKPEYVRPIPGEEIDLVLTPGLVFDKRGYRIGYGGGFYDRFFAGLTVAPLKIALAYDLQVIDRLIPAEPFDMPVDMIVTEKRLIICHREGRSGSR